MNENIIQLRGKKNSMMAKWNRKVSVDFFFTHIISLKILKRKWIYLEYCPAILFLKETIIKNKMLAMTKYFHKEIFFL